MTPDKPWRSTHAQAYASGRRQTGSGKTNTLYYLAHRYQQLLPAPALSSARSTARTGPAR